MSGSDSSTRRAFLVAWTDEARAAPGHDEPEITVSPFRVGRESRRPTMSRKGLTVERRRAGAKQSNDLYLVEAGEQPVRLPVRDPLRVEERRNPGATGAVTVGAGGAEPIS